MWMRCGHLCFQVKEGDLPLLPPVKGDSLFMVPQGIRPVVQLTAIEVSPGATPPSYSTRFPPDTSTQDQTNPLVQDRR